MKGKVSFSDIIMISSMACVNSVLVNICLKYG